MPESRSFRRAAAKKKDQLEIVFDLTWVDDEDEEKVIKQDFFNAMQPTDEQLFIFAAVMGNEDVVGSEAVAVLELFRDILPPAQFRTLKARLSDPDDDAVTIEVLSEVMSYLMERWSTFPTVPSSASSQSPTSSGPKSTGRVRGAGSTRSPSPSVAS